MKNAIGYVRASTRAEDGYIVGVQRDAIKAFAYEKGYSIVEWVEDLGVSGADDISERPALSRVVYGDVFNPPIEAVIVAKTDSIASEITVYFSIKYLLKKKNIELLSCDYDFGELGELSIHLEAAFDALIQLERNELTQRTSAGRMAKAMQGGYAGGVPPYGYDVIKGELVVNEDEARVVRRIFELNDSGLSLRAMREVLKAEGIVNKRGKPFHYSTLGVIVNNRPTYEGYYRYGDMEGWVEGKHEAILERSEPDPTVVETVASMTREGFGVRAIKNRLDQDGYGVSESMVKLLISQL